MMHYPYLKCKGCNRKLLTTVREHLIINDCHPDFRIWRELGNRDSTDEVWEGGIHCSGLVHDDYSQSGNSDHQWDIDVSGEEPTREGEHAKIEEDPSFDPDALVEAMSKVHEVDSNNPTNEFVHRSLGEKLLYG
jgi:hypothetical protein